jgi:type II secretory pathway pseudopilin PulG
MTNFKEAQEQIERARRLHQQSRQSWLTVSEKLQKTERRIASLRRRSDDEARQQLQTLLREQEALRADTAKQQAEFQQNRQILIDQELLFEVFSDPTRNISQLNDNHPILLFPMRIETRFKAVAGDGDNGDRNQLWVRVYPDDINIDTFEALPSETEASNARIYWTNIWKAGGIDAEKRAAWQSLVKSHGAGRAYWLPTAEPGRRTGQGKRRPHSGYCLRASAARRRKTSCATILAGGIQRQ